MRPRPKVFWRKVKRRLLAIRQRVAQFAKNLRPFRAVQFCLETAEREPHDVTMM